MSAVRRRRRLVRVGAFSLALAGTTTAWRAAPVATTQGPPVWAMSTDAPTSAELLAALPEGVEKRKLLLD